VFAFNVASRGWLFGRVAATECQGGGCVLVYIYRVVQDTSTPVPMLDKRQLLFPPTFVFPTLWTRGYFVTVREGAPAPGDLFERHCFDNTFGRYVDEQWKPIERPFEPCGHTGIAGPIPFDNDVSDALGLPRIQEHQRENNGAPPVPTKDGAGGITVYIPMLHPDRAGEIEDHFRKAIETRGGGVWDGHGFDLTSGLFDTRFSGASRRRLIEALRSATASIEPPLPEGSYAIVQPKLGDRPERIDL
jgi:hypothetical protein